MTSAQLGLVRRQCGSEAALIRGGGKMCCRRAQLAGTSRAPATGGRGGIRRAERAGGSLVP